jgi:hypothetical protein
MPAPTRGGEHPPAPATPTQQTVYRNYDYTNNVVFKIGRVRGTRVPYSRYLVCSPRSF